MLCMTILPTLITAFCTPAGQALPEDLGQQAGIEPQAAQIQPGEVLHPAHPPQAQEEAEALGDHRGRRRSRDAPAEHRHKSRSSPTFSTEEIIR